MKQLLGLTFLFGLFIALSTLAQTGVPVTAALPAASSPGLIAWLQANWVAVVAPLGIAVVDFFWALNPNLQSNGILHAIFTALGGKTPPSTS